MDIEIAGRAATLLQKVCGGRYGACVSRSAGSHTQGHFGQLDGLAARDQGLSEASRTVISTNDQTPWTIVDGRS